MSVPKLIAEADKLFEKGKVPDGIAKLKAAISEEPLNQLVVTKLANVLIQERQPLEAAKVYGGLAKRLSEAGKSQVAIAIFKQALELSPDDIALRSRFAQECESIGKLSDAFLQAQIVLNYYLRRKKFFDASNILPLMARTQPKDEKIRQAWVEVLQLCQAEQKLVHLLVALCGPPGLQSTEFPQGGDPVALSPPLYDGIKKLVPFFPRDPKVAYAVAWSAFRRGQLKDFYHYLRECLRREPDFCLAMLLFARALAESKKLNEAMFVYRYYKERMTADKSTDMLTLNRLMEAFVEKNGWIKFIEDSGDLLDTAGFFKVLTGEEQKIDEQAEAAKKEEEESKRLENGDSRELPPAEIDIGGAAPPSEMEILTATGQSIAEVKAKRPLGKDLSDPMRMQAELIKATIEATVAATQGAASPTQQTVVQPVVLPVIQAAAVQGAAQAAPPLSPDAIAQATAAAAKSVEASPPAAPAEAPKEPARPAAAAPAAQSDDTRTSLPDSEPTGEVEGFQGESVEFTSLIRATPDGSYLTEGSQAAIPAPAKAAPSAPPAAPAPAAASAAPAAPASAPQADPAATQVAVAAPAADKTVVAPASADDRTMMKPLTQDAADDEEAPESLGLDQGGEPESAPKKKTFNPFDAALPATEGGSSLRLEEPADERTQMFSPIEVLDAAKVMQNRDLGDVDTKEIVAEGLGKKPADEKPKVPVPPPVAGEVSEADKTKWKNLKVEGEKTIEFSPVEAVQAGVNSRRPMEAMVKAAEPKPADASGPDLTSGDPTVMTPRPDSAVGAVTGKVEVGPGAVEASISRELEIPPPQEGAASIEVEAAPEPTAVSPAAAPTASEGAAFMPIPTAAVTARPGADEEKADLGTDLLEGPTRIFTQPTAADKTEHLIKEIKRDLKSKVNARLNIDTLMKQAERYTAKRNYYLARKALRHAQALGADEEIVKARLREIRKLELPEGLYNTISSDQTEAKVDTAAVLEQLEQEFDLIEEDGSDELGNIVADRIEEIFRENDSRTILDFGVGLHEMGLFRQAEELFMRLVEEFPDQAFDAYYLAAISKLSRRDYAGAASILKRLSSDNAKTDLEKIQIYYALGETFEKMRQRDRSKKFFKKVAELDANYRNIRHKLEE